MARRRGRRLDERLIPVGHRSQIAASGCGQKTLIWSVLLVSEARDGAPSYKYLDVEKLFANSKGTYDSLPFFFLGRHMLWPATGQFSVHCV